MTLDSPIIAGMPGVTLDNPIIIAVIATVAPLLIRLSKSVLETLSSKSHSIKIGSVELSFRVGGKNDEIIIQRLTEQLNTIDHAPGPGRQDE
jgi:hypothetical protein